MRPLRGLRLILLDPPLKRRAIINPSPAGTAFICVDLQIWLG